MVKHFFKTLLTFAGIILVGLIGVILVNYFGAQGTKQDNTINRATLEK